MSLATARHAATAGGRWHTAGVGRLISTAGSFRGAASPFPVGADDLVLDVGSGDKPHWRADVLLDRYADADARRPAIGAGRGHGLAARCSTPMRPTMPFADGVFDYVICSHVLEHVPDPAAVVDEITRVGRAGYIEVPEAASAKILDFPSHLWWCRLDDDDAASSPRSDACVRPRDRRLHRAGRPRAAS